MIVEHTTMGNMHDPHVRPLRQGLIHDFTLRQMELRAAGEGPAGEGPAAGTPAVQSKQ